MVAVWCGAVCVCARGLLPAAAEKGVGTPLGGPRGPGGHSMSRPRFKGTPPSGEQRLGGPRPLPHPRSPQTWRGQLCHPPTRPGAPVPLGSGGGGHTHIGTATRPPGTQRDGTPLGNPPPEGAPAAGWRGGKRGGHGGHGGGQRGGGRTVGGHPRPALRPRRNNDPLVPGLEDKNEPRAGMPLPQQIIETKITFLCTIILGRGGSGQRCQGPRTGIFPLLSSFFFFLYIFFLLVVCFLVPPPFSFLAPPPP